MVNGSVLANSIEGSAMDELFLSLFEQFKEDLSLLQIVVIWLIFRLNTQVFRPLRSFLVSLKDALDRKDFSHEALEYEIRSLRKVFERGQGDFHDTTQERKYKRNS